MWAAQRKAKHWHRGLFNSNNHGANEHSHLGGDISEISVQTACIGCKGYWFSCAITGIRQDNPGTTLPSERLWGKLLDMQEIIMFWHQGRPEMPSACTNSLSSAVECLRDSYATCQGCIQVQRLQAVGKSWEDPRKIWEKCSSLTKHSQGSTEITSSKLPQTALT